MTSGGNCFARVATAQLRRQDDGRMECDAMTRGVPVLDPRRDLKGATNYRLIDSLAASTPGSSP